MADKRITELTALAQAGVDAAQDQLAIADVSATETKKISPGELVAAGLGGLPPGSIPGSAIQSNSITSLQLGPDSVTSVELANNAVDTGAIQQGAVTGGATGAIALNTITANNLAAGAVDNAAIAAGAVNGTSIAAGVIDNSHIQANSLQASALAPDSVGQSELADGSVDTPALIDAAVTTPKIDNGAVTDAKLAAGIDGSKLQNGSVGTNQIADGSVTNDKITSIGLDKLGVAPSGTFLGGPPIGASAAPTFRPIQSSDIPAATDTTRGGVRVEPTSGLALNADSLSINNTITPNTSGAPVVNYDAHGLITGSRGLQNSELPVPTLGEPGAVKAGDGVTIAPDGTLSVSAPTGGGLGAVKAGDGIDIDVDGTIHQSVTGVTAGEYTKLTTDERGNITAAAQLQAADIPNIDFTQVDNVAIDSSQIANGTILQRHFADDAVTVVGDQEPPLKGSALFGTQFGANNLGEPVRGTFWFDNAASRLYVWEGTKWNAVFEDLSQNNLRYGGNVNADTGLISLVNSYGASAGYAVGEAPRTATKDVVGLYFVVDTASASGPGFTVSQLTGITYDAGDWILASKLGQSGSDDGWRHINTVTTTGGGGGALTNHNLFSGTHADVVANGTITAGQLVKAVEITPGSIEWQNTSVIDCGSNDYA